MEDPAKTATIPPKLQQLRDRVSVLVERLGRGLYEREEAVRLCLLAALAGESVFLLGPPGVAKSLIARRLKDIFHPEARAFEYLMNRFSTPDEIFGPISIKSLKRDRLKRKTELYLPKATVVFLDEIWKAGPSIQNTLLTVINERKFRNGEEEQDVSLRILISASNELPEEGQGLEALWDRFLIRLLVTNINDPQNRRQLLRDSAALQKISIAAKERFTDEQLREIDEAVDKVTIPDPVFDVIEHLVDSIKYYNDEVQSKETDDFSGDIAVDGEELKPIYVSDRRWKKIGRLLRVSALLNGRDTVSLEDCFLMRYCIWGEESNIEKVYELVRASVEWSLGPRYYEEKERAWSSLERDYDDLPTVALPQPKAYDYFFKVRLVGKKDLLTDKNGIIFGRLDKVDYKALDVSRLKDVKLYQNSVDDKREAGTVHLQGRRGGSPIQVILESDGDGGLGAFPATEFLLEKRGGTAESVDFESEAKERYSAEIRSFRAEIEETRSFLAELWRHFSPATRRHLFVTLSPGDIDNLQEVIEDTSGEFDGLVAKIHDFCRDRGVR